LGPKRGDGEFAAAVNRVPAADDLRSNMVSGGGAQATELSPREREIYATLGRALRERATRWARCRCENLGRDREEAGRKIISPSR
jgi:hypothetical protein